MQPFTGPVLELQHLESHQIQRYGKLVRMVISNVVYNTLSARRLDNIQGCNVVTTSTMTKRYMPAVCAGVPWPMRPEKISQKDRNTH